jgi:pyrophosphatase PpaX
LCGFIESGLILENSIQVIGRIVGHKIDTVIFDLDGTLVDSQPAALGATIEALSRYGVHVSEGDLREQFGGGARKLLGYFLVRELGSDQAGKIIDDAVLMRNDLQLTFTDGVVLLPGVNQLLRLLRDSNYRLALATMSARNVVEHVTTYHEINELFDVMMTADDVVNAKPDPEILTKTIDQLGAQVECTLYIGDSSHDLEAALSMGMPFLLADTGIYVRGEMREKLRAAAERNGFPTVGLNELSNIPDIVMSTI